MSNKIDREKILMIIESMEANAHRLLKDAAILREELSGGSDSSNLKKPLSKDHIKQLIDKRNSSRFKK